MAKPLLLDTGPLVALVDRKDSFHTLCLEWLKNFRGELVSTEAVLTEALYLLNDSIYWQKACINFSLQTGIQWVPLSPARLRRSLELMEKYADAPMDYADATLVSLAEETGIQEIFTLDKVDFTTYRLPKKTSFKIYPQE